ncbi:MAG TPA: cell envelope integrity protein TolA [Candidatus Wunengus sp. YC65]|uniref:cell envelope integrity protein TolA n=1 Tax=Candidatus Wunengus sp. YC65 TaxID=3367701 RepID=UPI004025ADF4
MFVKLRTDFFNKNLFPFLIAASLAIHGIIIFLTPQGYQFLSFKSLRDSFIREPSEYAVMMELEDTDAQIEDTSLDTKQDQNEDELKKEAEKKKYKIFTDTSDNTEDEKPGVESDKIGEKGSVAKDNFPDSDQPVNNEPHAEGRSKAPLMGKGGNPLPGDDKQPPQEQETTAQAFIAEDSPYDRNSPPRYANLPQGLEKQEEPAKQPQIPQPQTVSEEHKEKTGEAETIKQEKTIKTETTIQAPKRERLTIGRGIVQEEAAEALPNSEGMLFTDKQDDTSNESEKKEESLSSSLQEEETEKKNEVKSEKFAETKEKLNKDAFKPEEPVPASEMSGVEPQRRLERGLDEQESPGELKKPKVSFNVNAKTEGANKDPALFEDTISNAAIPGAPSFNVQKHEYASYFKHIRDRISLYWFLGYGTRAEIKLETKDDKPIIIEFKVLPDGSIDDVKIADDAGNFQLASRLVSSIKNAAPLNPFPSDIKEPSIDVKFNFYFF